MFSVPAIYELTPRDSRKSFYGKALIIEMNNGDVLLQSYSTIILIKKPDGKLIRTWDGWSATTGRHIASFCGLNKKEYLKLPLDSASFYGYGPVPSDYKVSWRY